MGDSYSSGEGTHALNHGSYLPGTDDPSAFNSCHRSDLAYGPLLDADAKLGTMLFVACSGATTDDFYNVNHDNPGERAQLEQLAKVGGATKVVTLTIGGNDAGFLRALDRCVEGWRPDDATHSAPGGYWYNPSGCSKDKSFTRAVADRIALLDGKTPKTQLQVGPPVHSVAEVLKDIHQRARRATVYIAGYPHLFGGKFQPAAVTRKMVCPVARISLPFGTGNFQVESHDAAWINDQADALNKVIDHQVSVAAKADSTLSVHYVSAGLFLGHGLCDFGQSWLNPLIVNGDDQVDVASFHPTADGQHLGYENAFLRRMTSIN